ncbi:MAG TPA: hypothetical protein VHB93_01095 [Candidatus Paceibacterota bacterium]|nr:hypothetical protein [Candidatus Paceibacterota bacterium]
MRSIISKTAITALVVLLGACTPSSYVTKSKLNEQVRDVETALQDGSFQQSVGVAKSSAGKVTAINGVVEFPHSRGYVTFDASDDSGPLVITLTFNPTHGQWTDYVTLKNGECIDVATLNAVCADVSSSKWWSLYSKIAAIAKEKGL